MTQPITGLIEISCYRTLKDGTGSKISYNDMTTFLNKGNAVDLICLVLNIALDTLES